MPAPDPRPGDPIAQVVVVCRANRARSPLVMAMLAAEAATRELGDAQVWVRSAGTSAVVGAPAAEGSRALARAWGLDLDHHHAEQLTRHDVANADLVLVMTAEQRDLVRRTQPDAGDRVFTLLEFARLCADARPATPDVAVRDHVRGVVAHAAGARGGDLPAHDDVVDPVGRRASAFDEMAALVVPAVVRTSLALFGRPAPGGAR